MNGHEGFSMTAAFLVAFACGAIPTSYILVKRKLGQDIRTMGSGNPGATNVFRTIGFKEGMAVLILDFLKGAIPVFFLPMIFQTSQTSIETYKFLLALSAILGHVFTPFLAFRGGKGVAVGAGAAFALFPLNFGVSFLVWIVTLRTIGFMSLASLLSAYVFAISTLLTSSNHPLQIMAFCAVFFLTWTHRANIRRLLKGEEPPFKFRK